MADMATAIVSLFVAWLRLMIGLTSGGKSHGRASSNGRTWRSSTAGTVPDLTAPGPTRGPGMRLCRFSGAVLVNAMTGLDLGKSKRRFSENR